MRRNVLAWLLVLALALGAMPAAFADASQVRTFVDSAGRAVEVPAQIDRIAPSGKMAHIVLYAIAPEKFVCLSNAWTQDAAAYFPEALLDLPVVGQFYGSSELNMEELAAADPQVIIDIGEAKGSVAEDMDGVQAQLGIPTVFIEANVRDMGECYRKLGELLGLEAEGEAIAAYCEAVYGRTVERVALLGDAGKAKVLYCLGEDGLSVIGKGGYHAEIIDMLGVNVAVIENPSSKAFGDPVDMEQILLWEPEFVFFAPDVDVDAVLRSELWQSMAAIKGGRYAQVPAGPYNWMGFPPSVNRYIGMIWMGNVLYPDVFAEDMYAEARAYYEMFYHYELSEAQFAELTK